MGEKGIGTVESRVAVLRSKMAVDGSRWQLLGRARSHFAPRDAIAGDFLGIAEETQFDFRNLLIDHRHVPSDSAASPNFLIPQMGCRTDSHNLEYRAFRCNTGPTRIVVLERLASSRSEIAGARTFTHTSSLHAPCQFVKLSRMRILHNSFPCWRKNDLQKCVIRAKSARCVSLRDKWMTRGAGWHPRAGPRAVVPRAVSQNRVPRFVGPSHSASLDRH
jgi:hypothetical protein